MHAAVFDWHRSNGSVYAVKRLVLASTAVQAPLSTVVSQYKFNREERQREDSQDLSKKP